MIAPRLNEHDFKEFVRHELFSKKKGEVEGEQKNKIGIELEIFPYIKKNNERIAVELFEGNPSLIDLLVQVSERFNGEPVKNSRDEIEKIKFLNGNYFHFEPGGQIEIRTIPCTSILDLGQQLNSCKKILKEVSKISDFRFSQTGYNPNYNHIHPKNQLRNPRYLNLESYLNDIGPYGNQMMFQTFSMHLNVDLEGNKSLDFKKIVLANLLVPFTTALFANSSNYIGENNLVKSYRSFIWQQLDSKRTGMLPLKHVLRTENYEKLIEEYSRFAMRAPLIYIPHGNANRLGKEVTMEYWLKNPIEGLYPNKSDFENHFSLLFPEVRIKRYIEIRTLDAPPHGWEFVPVLFYLGLFSNELSIKKALKLLIPLEDKMNELYARSIYGLRDDELFKYGIWLMEIALNELQCAPQFDVPKSELEKFEFYFENYSKRRFTFVEINKKHVMSY